MMSTMNSRQAGCPTRYLTVDLREIEESIENVTLKCHNEKTKERVLEFLYKCKSELTSTVSMSTDTGDLEDDDDIAEQVVNSLENFSQSDLSFILKNCFLQTPDVDKVERFYELFDLLNEDQQCELFSKFGFTINQSLYETSLIYSNQCETFEDLSEEKKTKLFQEADPRLKYFLISATQTQRRVKDNLLEISNIYESMVKARNKNFTSSAAIKEHMVAYISSGRSKYVSQIMSKLGKGSFPLLENIIRQSELKCRFSAPDNVSVFVSFDNIQQLMKSNRVSTAEQEKVYAVVVTSILAVLPDGLTVDNIQFVAQNAPGVWNTEYMWHPDSKDILVEKLDSDSLTKIIHVTSEDEAVLNEVWDRELQQELDDYYGEVDEDTLKDDIDIKIEVQSGKRRKVCREGHINEIKTERQKYCKEKSCKALLEDAAATEEEIENNIETPAPSHPEEKRRQYYMNVENIKSGEVKEVSMGAIGVNPNTSKRVTKVLDDILEKADMKNKYSCKLVIENEDIRKEIVGNDGERSWLLVTVDGVPYRQLISIIKNHHQCVQCGKKIKYLSELTDHMKSSGHNEFYQTYGNILMNIGNFHFVQAMLRSYTNLLWFIDTEELAKSLELTSPKALFMVHKVTDFRKCMDIIRSTRKAKLRELILPFIKHCISKNLICDINHFKLWKKTFVKNKTWLMIYEIEKNFGTSLLLYISGMRANNYPVMKAAKKCFSPLFHVNQNPIYSQLDIHSDYIDEQLKSKAPHIENYLESRRCTNKTGLDYHSEPHDERHEEFNKRGLNFGVTNSAENFIKNFSVADSYFEMRDSLLQEYEIKKPEGEHRVPDYSFNVERMQICMRKKGYLCHPEINDDLLSLDGKQLDESLLNLTAVSRERKQQNVLKVMQSNDFLSSLNTKRVKILKDTTKVDKIDYDEQAKILISSETNTDIRSSLYDYWQSVANEKSFDKKLFVQDLINKTYSFL